MRVTKRIYPMPEKMGTRLIILSNYYSTFATQNLLVPVSIHSKHGIKRESCLIQELFP